VAQIGLIGMRESALREESDAQRLDVFARENPWVTPTGYGKRRELPTNIKNAGPTKSAIGGGLTPKAASRIKAKPVYP